MQVDVHADQKIVSAWLSHNEQHDAMVQEQLLALYAAYAPRKYRVCVFYSGHDNLSDLTLDLLYYNRKKMERDQMDKEALFI